MDLLQIREKEIFETIIRIKNEEFVIIGGYAVNAYTLPRFSVDCDIVVKNEEDEIKIGNLLKLYGYKKITEESDDIPYLGTFARYEKSIENNFKVSIDILVKNVLDRMTNSTFSATWIFENSKVKELRGKTIQEKIKTRIIDADALFVMKAICARSTDIRDVFMLVSEIKDRKWIEEEIKQRIDFKDKMSKITQRIESKDFRNGLQGVFGFLDEKAFDKHKKMILDLIKS